MTSSEAEIQQKIQDKGLNAPRLTPDHIDRMIASETYTNLPDGRTIVCQLTLQNGYTVDGTSACVSKDNFNQEIGNGIARTNAREKIWQLEGYLLKQRLFDRDRGYSIGAPHDGSPLTSGNLPVSGLMGDVAPMFHESLAHDFIPPKPSHQQRVIDELNELSIKLTALNGFIGNTENFCALCDADEQGRLLHQQVVMQDYVAILQERIAAFTA